MTRVALLLAGLAGCNQTFGIEGTQLDRDAAPTDCPAIGTAPRFARAVKQAVQQDCVLYHFNGDGSLATAFCSTGAGSGTVISVGRRDGLLDPVPELATVTGAYYSNPRPSPTRRRIYVAHRITTAPISSAIAPFDETTPGAWSTTGRLSIPYKTTSLFSTVFRGPTGDRLIVFDGGDMIMREYEEESGTWVQRGPDRPRLAGFAGFESLSLTSDGLRATFRDAEGERVMYVDRPDLDSWFGVPQLLEGAPVLSDTQLTDDCTRLYYAGLESIFYSQQN